MQDAVNRHIGDAKVTSVERITRNGKSIYEVEYTSGHLDEDDHQEDDD